VRTYIFTARERTVIRAFLDGKILGTGKVIGMIRLRIRNFKDLAGDVELYSALRRKFAKPVRAVST